MPIVQTPLEGLPEEEKEALEELELEEEQSEITQLEGYSHSDLDLWLESPFWKVLMEYMGELKEQLSRILLEGTVNTEQLLVQGSTFRSDDGLRGAIIIIKELEDCRDILAEFLDEANENYRDRLRSGE